MSETENIKTLQHLHSIHAYVQISYYTAIHPCDKWVHVTTAWHVLRLRMEEWPPIWRVAVNKLNKQLQTADKGWSFSLGVGRGANASPWKPMLRNTHKARCFLWRQNNPEINHSPTRISTGGVFLEEVSCSRQQQYILALLLPNFTHCILPLFPYTTMSYCCRLLFLSSF
jgi:hypothetical protein